MLVACLLHATTFALLRADPRAPRAIETPTAELDANPIDVTFEDEKVAPTSPESAAAHAPVAIERSRTRSTASESAGTLNAIDSVAPPLDSSMPLVRPLPGNDDVSSWTFRSTREAVDLKLGDKTASLGRDMAAHGQLDLPPPRSPAGMTEGLDAMDVERGFGRAGAVVQAIEAVVRDPAAPPIGVAFFDVAIEKSGKISVSVSEATSNREDWERLTTAIAASLKTKDVRFPDQGKGLKIGVRVEAKVRYPDGRDPKKSGTYAHGTGFKTHKTKDGEVLDELPSVSVGVRGKVCSGAVTMTMLGPQINGGCSPENIGTHPERTVAAHETYEQRM